MHMLNINNAMPKSKIEFISDVRFVLFLVCLYIFVYECLFQNNIAGVPSSRATSGSPQYCASTCARFFCTRHASCVDSKPKKKMFSYNPKPKTKSFLFYSLFVCISAFACVFKPKVHCWSAVQFGRALLGFPITTHHLYAFLM